MTAVHDLPEVEIISRCVLDLGLGSGLRVGHTMLTNQMVLKIILPVADMRTVWTIAIPALEVPMLLVLMADIVCLSFEGLRILAATPRASKRGNVLCMTS